MNQSEAEPTSCTNAGSGGLSSNSVVNCKMRDEQLRESSGTLQVEIAGPSSSRAALVAAVDPETLMLLPPPPQQLQPQRIVPESLERIVEQLVLQNVEIQRILQRKKRRAAERQPSASSSSSSSRPYVVCSESTTLDEGIYDTLLSPSGPGSMMEAVGGVLSDIDGDYVTIRAEGGGGVGGGHFSRCHLRHSLGNKTPESMADSSQLAGLSNAFSCQQQLQKGHPQPLAVVSSTWPAGRSSGQEIGSLDRREWRHRRLAGNSRRPHPETLEPHWLAGSLVQLDPFLVAAAAEDLDRLAVGRAGCQQHQPESLEEGTHRLGRRSLEHIDQPLRSFRLAPDAERTSGGAVQEIRFTPPQFPGW